MEENNKAEEQLATATPDSPNHDDNVSQSNQESSTGRPPQEENQNWKEVRHIMREQRNEIENLRKTVSQLNAPQAQEADPMDSLSEDDVVTVSDMKRYAAKIAKQTAQELYEKRSVQQEIESTPSKYSDYYDVIKYVEPLVKENPALMGAIERAPNPREAAYRMAKMYLKGQNPNMEAAKKIEENLAKPKTSDSLSLGQSMTSSEKRTLSMEDKAKIYEQAQKYASMR